MNFTLIMDIRFAESASNASEPEPVQPTAVKRRPPRKELSRQEELWRQKQVKHQNSRRMRYALNKARDRMLASRREPMKAKQKELAPTVKELIEKKRNAE